MAFVTETSTKIGDPANSALLAMAIALLAAIFLCWAPLDAFTADLQSLAGDVFSEIGQIGTAVGLTVTEHPVIVGHAEEARMAGHGAAFWTTFAAAGAVLVIVLWDLGKGGTVGKEDE
ncbi:hypothetical protein LZ30DRAFT_787482 [Colletotrichum cereale]|nr:hypothetical protein LZ30DRAFT_787482 [Colletotrichum cereale]